MVVSLIELLPNLSDVGGNNHKVSMGEANQYIPIAVPLREKQRKRINFSTNIPLTWLAMGVSCCARLYDHVQYQR